MLMLAKFLIRGGLAFVFAYAALEMYMHPDVFIKYIPPFMGNLMNLDIFLTLFGVGEAALAIWLLTGWKGTYASLLSLFLLIGIVVFNLEHFHILFRNVAIGSAALALFCLEIPRNKRAIFSLERSTRAGQPSSISP